MHLKTLLLKRCLKFWSEKSTRIENWQMKFLEESFKIKCKDIKNWKCYLQSQSLLSNNLKWSQMMWENYKEIVWILKKSWDKQIQLMTNLQSTKHRQQQHQRRRNRNLKNWRVLKLKRRLLKRWWLKRSNNTFYRKDQSIWREMNFEISQWSSEKRIRNIKWWRKNLEKSELSSTFFQEQRLF